MKLPLTLILALVATFFIACSGNEKDTSNSRQQPVTTAPVTTTPSTSPATTPQPLNNTPTASANGVLHYYCTNNSCASKGSGGATKTNCPACGTAYTHNVAFHNQGTTAAPTTAQPNPMFQPGQQPPTQTTTAPAATNAAGVYHYICGKGCAGGGAAAGNCSNCGGALAHNTAFHN